MFLQICRPTPHPFDPGNAARLLGTFPECLLILALNLCSFPSMCAFTVNLARSIICYLIKLSLIM